MTECSSGSCCRKCIHPVCPPETAQPPYDEISHEMCNNIMSIKVPKNVSQIQELRNRSSDGHYQERGAAPPRFDVSCADSSGKKCKDGCVKVNVIPNRTAPAKQPDEEMFLLRSTRQYLNTDETKNSIEVEFKTPRNYIPWPDPGPTPPVISILPKKGATSNKGKNKAKKGKK